ncbi:uncharacterized protein VTP21DRAFT_5159 [Calcarisporiella thermophila]|uniref:uncharacterized protein n=1 Tax=Calcarisporiella thermophila TaxID=911321 RepID=UPI00374282B9
MTTNFTPRDHTTPVTCQPTAHALAPTYATEEDVNRIPHGIYGRFMNGLGAILGTLGAIPLCACFPNYYREIPQGYVGLITRFGRYYKIVDPGLCKVNPLTEELSIVDIKIQLGDIPSQSVMTKDNVSIQIDSVLYWHVVDPFVATFCVSNIHKALVERTQTTLRHIVGSRVLQDLVENREQIAFEIGEVIDNAAKQWGARVESILVKDIQFSPDLQESLSSAAKQKRIGESKVIAAQAEVEAAKLMRKASDILSTPAAMQIRSLETVSAMARNAGTKVIFMPVANGRSGVDTASYNATVTEQMAEH